MSEINNEFYNFVRNNVKLQEVKSNELKLNITCYGDINDVIKFRDIVREHFNKTVQGYKNGDSVNDIISSIESSFEGERTKEDFVKAIIFDLENN